MITLNGTAPNATVESNLTFDGTTLNVFSTSATAPLIIASGSSSNDLVRLTQTGAGNVLLVEDSTNPDSSPFVIDSNGSLGIGTVSVTTGVKLEVNGYVHLLGNPLMFSYVSPGNFDYIGTNDGSHTNGNANGFYVFRHDGAYSVAVGYGNSVLDAGSVYLNNTGDSSYIAGKLGIGTASPSYPLHVIGTTSTTAFMLPTGAVNGYVLTSDASGNATWAASTGGTGGGGTTVTNFADNRMITSDGTSTGLNAESNITFDGAQLNVTGSMKMTGTFSGNNTNFVQSELITQTVLLYMSNNT